MPLLLPNIESAPTFDAQAIGDATDTTAITGALSGTFVFSGCAVTQDSGTDMKAAVAAGIVFVKSVSYIVAATGGSPLTVAAASASDRKDIVVYTVGTGLQVVEGTACGTAGWTMADNPATAPPPIKPAIPANSVLLGEIYVAAATTAITTAANIIDKTTLGLVPALTGSVTAIAVAVANVTITSPGTTLDGVTLAAGNIIFLTAQTTASQNGLWVWNTSTTTLTRPSFFPSGSTMFGLQVYVASGTVYAGTEWCLSNTTSVVVDTTAQTWRMQPSGVTNASLFTTQLGLDQSTGITGTHNTAIGYGAGSVLSSSTNNTFVGYNAGNGITTTGGVSNTFVGSGSGGGVGANTSVALGYNSQVEGTYTANGNTAVGVNSTAGVLTGSSYNMALGYGTTAGSNGNAGCVAIGTDSGGNGAQAVTGGNQFVLGTSNHKVQVPGTFDITTAGHGIAVAEGSNAKQGTATLSGGTVVVANTSVTATSRIQLTAQTLGTVSVPSALCVSARTAGTSFTILASQPTDTSIVAYEIFEVG